MTNSSIFAYGGDAPSGTPATASSVSAPGWDYEGEYVPEPTVAMRDIAAKAKFCSGVDGRPCGARPAKGTELCAGHLRKAGRL